MNTQVNWQRIRSEFNRLTDVDKLKNEVQRIGTEIRKFDLHTVLSPAAQSKVKQFERRYATLMRSISQAQRQVDREFNRILRQIKVHRNDVDKAVAQQKNKLEKVSLDLRKRFSTQKAKPARPVRKRATAKTTATRKRGTAKKA